ncbi:DUF4365 domain-containing protein [Actinoplanes regularis]|uniref:DUF4365 domain-containing protein n=1 Tax=Actinoplanes regularis TaxID=52697 RepID=A0A238XFN4_9ACTN|nr:DUF4365 domain-containing protein [Actinoplanes regularis]GIE86734.1 hypothetical protein Are01nite_32140 [Actinoplanes regularis]SNR57303.1 protein of unknown function [Actinoplanes regularis]
MHKNVHQGLHGEGFIHALACAGGFITARATLDVDGVDLQIAFPGPRGTVRSPKIEVQVKSASSPSIRDGVLFHRLSAIHHNHLAGPGFQVPRFLAVVIVPQETADYAVCTDEHMRLSTAAYWRSLADQELRPVGEGHPESVTVEVPLRNLLTVRAIRCLLEGDLEGAAR